MGSEIEISDTVSAKKLLWLVKLIWDLYTCILTQIVIEIYSLCFHDIFIKKKELFFLKYGEAVWNLLILD